MRPMNHTRQLLKSLDKYPDSATHLSNERLIEIRLGIAAAEKFAMPAQGNVLEEKHAMAMLDSSELINLPFKSIVVEYVAAVDRLDLSSQGKDIILDHCGSLEGHVRELIYAQDLGDEIAICSAWSSSIVHPNDSWFVVHPLVAKKDNLVNFCCGAEDKIHWFALDQIRWDSNPLRREKETYLKTMRSAAFKSARVLINLIAALSCTNVTAPVTHTPKKSNPKAAYPFHSYRELMLGNRLASVVAGQGVGSSRSPREHLRRGHIRRLANGSRTWVNATVVNAGVGGSVDKTYRMNGQQVAV